MTTVKTGIIGIGNMGSAHAACISEGKINGMSLTAVCDINGKRLISPGADGINELTLSNAAYLSEWSGNTEILLPFDEALFDRMLSERAAASVSRDTAFNGADENTSYLSRWNVKW